MAASLVALLFSHSCGMPSLSSGRPTELCAGPCAMRLEVDSERPPFNRWSGEMGPKWDCPTLEASVRTALVSFWEHWTGYAAQRLLAPACDRIAAFTLYVDQDPRGLNHPWTGERATGVTDCYRREMKISNQEPSGSALTHELVHAVASCGAVDPPCINGEDCAHAGWERVGVVQSVYAANDSLRDAGL